MGVLFEPLDEIFGNRAKVRLLRALFGSEGELGVREAARVAQISHVAALRPLDELALMGVVHRKVAARQHMYRINEENFLYPALKHLFAEEQHRVNKAFESFKKVLKPHAGVLGAYVIGSAVRGQDNAGSDLDLLIVVRAESAAGAVTEAVAADVVRLRYQFGFMISPVVLSRKRLADMHRHADPFVINAAQDARTVIGPSLEKLLNGAH